MLRVGNPPFARAPQSLLASTVLAEQPQTKVKAARPPEGEQWVIARLAAAWDAKSWLPSHVARRSRRQPARGFDRIRPFSISVVSRLTTCFHGHGAYVASGFGLQRYIHAHPLFCGSAQALRSSLRFALPPTSCAAERQA